MTERIVFWLRVVLAEIRYAAGRIGYWVRPYDMIADRRRWRWEARTPCGWSRRVRLCAQCQLGRGVDVPAGDPRCRHDEQWWDEAVAGG